MYKKFFRKSVFIGVFFFCFLCAKEIKGTMQAVQTAFEITFKEDMLIQSEKSTFGIVAAASSGQRIIEYDVIQKEQIYELSEQDREVLLRIVEAEAGGEDENGKLLVANVVLNRMNSEEFPDTISEVVFQKENGVTQFSPVSDGRIWSVEISTETVNAVGRALIGEDISQGALYFAAREYADSDKMEWFDRNLCFLFEYGGHEFFR